MRRNNNITQHRATLDRNASVATPASWPWSGVIVADAKRGRDHRGNVIDKN